MPLKRDNSIWHKSKGNRYGDKEAIACVPTRINLPLGHTATFTMKWINCPLCIERMISDREQEISHLRDMMKGAKKNLDKCQKNFKVEVKRLVEYKPDSEILDRIRAGV